MGKSTISMAIFHCFLYVHQRVGGGFIHLCQPATAPRFCRPGTSKLSAATPALDGGGIFQVWKNHKVTCILNQWEYDRTLIIIIMGNYGYIMAIIMAIWVCLKMLG